MKNLVLFILSIGFMFGQSTIEDKGSTCNPKTASRYTQLISQKFVSIEDKDIKEITTGLSSLSISKRTVFTKEDKETFIHFKIFTFLSQNSSKYVVYENSLTIDEAKTLLLDLINLDEQYRKNESSGSQGLFTSFTNTEFFLRSGYEFLKEKDKTPTGQTKTDRNGDAIFKTQKNWFINLDTSCGDNKTYFKINNILEFIELVRNTINS